MSNTEAAALVISARSRLEAALTELRKDAGQVVNTSGPAPAPFQEEDLTGVSSYLVVGKAEGAPGETVIVEILAMTTFPVTGISVGIGCNPALRLVAADETEELKTFLNVTDPQDIIRQQRGRGWQEQFIQVAIFFFESLWSQAEVGQDPDDVDARKKIGRRIVELMIPPMTPVYRLHLKIPQDAEPGTTFPLSLEFTYGKKLSSNGPVKFLPHPNMFTTTREVAKHGAPVGGAVSGWVDVVEPNQDEAGT